MRQKMTQKMKSCVAFLMAMAVVVTSVLMDYTPAKAAETGFVEGENITSDKSMAYGWAGDSMTLSIATIVGTEVEWNIDRNDGAKLTMLPDSEHTKGIQKNCQVTFDDSAKGDYKVSVTAGSMKRECTLTVRKVLTEIEGDVVTDFKKQYTENSFIVKTIVKESEAANLQWSVPADKQQFVTIEPVAEREDGKTYPGSVVKYAKVTLAKEKPQDGTVAIIAQVGEESSTTEITVYKAAEAMKDIKIVSSTNEVDLTKYPHMDGDNYIYVDTNETIEITGKIEGTLIEDGYINDRVLVSQTDFEEADKAVTQSPSATEKVRDSFGYEVTKFEAIEGSDSSYIFHITIEGKKAGNLPGQISILTQSGKLQKRYTVKVLCAAKEIGISEKSKVSKIDLKNYEALYKKNQTTWDIEGTQDTNIIGGGAHIVEGKTRELACQFLGDFEKDSKINKYNWVCDSTDEVEWISDDENVATVVDGKITGVNAGDTIITARTKATKTSPRDTLEAKYYVVVTDVSQADTIEIKRGSEVLNEDTIYTTESNVQYTVAMGESNEDVYWTSSDDKIFTVDRDGLVTPVSTGEAVLTATTATSFKTASVTIRVVVPVREITLNRNVIMGGVDGHYYRFIATVNEDADENEVLTWSTSNADVLSFVDPGDVDRKEMTTFTGKEVLVKVKKPTESAAITVKGQYLASATATTTVVCATAIPADNVTISYNKNVVSATEMDLYKGKNIVLSAYLEDANKRKSNDDYIWEIKQDKENPAVKYDVTELENKEELTLEPLTKGDVEIILRSQNTNALASVKLHIKVAATEFSLPNKENELDAIYMVPGTTYKLNTKVAPTDTTDVINFESSNPQVVSIDQDGLITALKESTETVTISGKINDTLAPITLHVKVQVPMKEMVAKDLNGKEIKNNGYVNVYLNNYNEIELQCGDSNEAVKWTLLNAATAEKTASISVQPGTHKVRINGNANGSVTLVGETYAKHEDGNTLKMTITINVVNHLTGLESFVVPEKIAYNAVNSRVTATVKQYGDDVVFTTSDPEIAVISSTTRSQNTFTGIIEPKKAGTVDIIATSADGLYTTSKTLKITEVNLPRPTLDFNRFDYDGKVHKPQVTLKVGDKELKAGTDYTITIPNSVNAGSYAVKVEGKGNYVGSYEIGYSIVARTMEKAAVTLSSSSFTYTGDQVLPKVTVKDLGKTLSLKKDYTVQYSNNVNVGTATVRITGVNGGNYSGNVLAEFTIKPASITKVKFAKIPDLTYNGNAQNPSLTATFGKVSVYANSSYKVTCSSNKNPGKMKITIKGINNFTGSRTLYCYIKPARVNNFSVTMPKTKTMKMTWQKDKTATGYEIYYSTKDSFAKKYRKTVSITKNKTVSKTVKRLKTGKTYYVKIRSYKKVGSKKVYSDWSNVSTVTIQ